MAADVRDLPEALRDAAARARAAVPKHAVVPIDVTPLPEKFQQWAREFVATGELRRALDEAAAGDPDLAS